MHGYTHQYSNINNPYSAVSAEDFEFYRAHFDNANSLVFDGPVGEDGVMWASQRINSGLKEFKKAGLPKPRIFEFPHYAGSDTDSRVVKWSFPTVYHRSTYFNGVLTGRPIDYQHSFSLFYPYPVQDLYGFKVIPENLGFFSPGNIPSSLAQDLIHTAQVNRVVRDGFASFYFHPFFDINSLTEIVSGIRAAGYKFVRPASL
jgi:uncharacterized protein YdaL